MRDSRRSVSLCSFTINSRVELLPQSSAATTSVTDVLPEKFRYAGFGRDEGAHGVARTDEEVREVGVQALHADLADSFDAMTSARPYRAPLSVGSALSDLVRMSPEKYDPNVVQGLLIQ